MNTPNTGLNIDELVDLEEFLMSDQTPDACMDASTLDGFLTAVISSPRPTSVNYTWLPWVWDTELAQAEPAFSSLNEREFILGLIDRHLVNLQDNLCTQSENYEPVFFFDEDNEEMPNLKDWCIGYLIAVTDEYDLWEPYLTNYAELFEPIKLFGTDEGQAKIDAELNQLNPEKQLETTELWAKKIRQSALEIFQATKIKKQ
jgi:uncharacterized protein